MSTAGHVMGFIVESMVLPAAEQNTDPLIGQRPNGSLMLFAFYPLALVEGRSPARLLARQVGVFMKRLQQEFRAGPTTMDPAGTATLLRDRSDARQLLNFAGPTGSGRDHCRKRPTGEVGKRAPLLENSRRCHGPDAEQTAQRSDGRIPGCGESGLSIARPRSALSG